MHTTFLPYLTARRFWMPDRITRAVRRWLAAPPPMRVPALAAAGALLLASCATDSALTRVPTSADGARQRAVEQRVCERVNEYRQAHGLPALRRHHGLDRLARQHAAFLIANRGKFSLHGRNVSHSGFEERALAARHLYQVDTLAENVIAGAVSGSDPGAVLVDGWLGSSAHRKNLSGRWQVTGIGVAMDADGHVAATQLFGCVSLSASPFEGPGAAW